MLVLSCCLIAAAAEIVGRDANQIDLLRKQLLSDLDSAVPPSTDGAHGIEIGLQLRIFKVIDVNLATGRLVLKIWRRMQWYDDRLAWNVSEWPGVIPPLLVYPGRRGGEGHYLDNNLWTPDVVMYNALSLPDDALEVGAAWVHPDGRVWSSVPGVVEVMCRFTGLVAFPRDRLSCPIEFGHWSYSDVVNNLTALNGGYEISPQSPASGTSYQQYKLESAEAWRTSRLYPCCPNTPYSQLNIRVWMTRTASAYILTIEMPGIIFTMLSFLVFWLDVTQVGERLGFGATMLLSIQLLMTIVADITPLCGETLWIEAFNWVNFLFCTLSIVESVVVVYIAFGGLGTIDEEAAEKVDYWARRLVPSTWAICLSCVYNLTPNDGYLGDWAKTMFEGMPSEYGVSGSIATIPSIILAIVLAKWAMNRWTQPDQFIGRALKKYREFRVAKKMRNIANDINITGENDSPEPGDERDERALMRDLIIEVQRLATQQARLLEISGAVEVSPTEVFRGEKAQKIPKPVVISSKPVAISSKPVAEETV